MPKAPALTPIIIGALSIGVFLLVMNFAILPEKKATKATAGVDTAEGVQALLIQGKYCKGAPLSTSAYSGIRRTTEVKVLPYFSHGAPWVGTNERPIWTADCFSGGDVFDPVWVGNHGTVWTWIDANLGTVPAENSNTNKDSESTTGWKTYTNTQNGFSFLYPQDWYIQDTQTNSWVLESWNRATVVAHGGLDSGMIKADFSFQTASVTPDCSVSGGETFAAEILVSCDDVSFNGVTYKKQVTSQGIEGGGLSVSYWTLMQGKLFRMNGAQNADDGIAMLEQIASTFTFMNEPG